MYFKLLIIFCWFQRTFELNTVDTSTTFLTLPPCSREYKTRHIDYADIHKEYTWETLTLQVLNV